jgi:RNA polymerase sigma-70 factor (ECF subfamily)
VDLSRKALQYDALQCIDGLYGYAMALARNEAEAQDLVQETYLRALRAFARLRPDSNLKAWLFKIMRNLWLNQLRRRRGELALASLHEPPNDALELEAKSSDDPLLLYLAKITQVDVRKAVENLPAVYREVILLREFEELSYEEIAQLVDCPLGTVMSRLSRARRLLKHALWQLDLRNAEAAYATPKVI